MSHAEPTKLLEPEEVHRVDLPGRDSLLAQRFADGWKITVIGCEALTQKVRSLQLVNGDPRGWALPTGQDHVDLLLRELILRVRGEWKFPFSEAELCHCRAVPTTVVDQAIICGAHTTRQVSQETNASTNCGTCRPDVQKILDYRLKKDSAS